MRLRGTEKIGRIIDMGRARLRQDSVETCTVLKVTEMPNLAKLEHISAMVSAKGEDERGKGRKRQVE